MVELACEYLGRTIASSGPRLHLAPCIGISTNGAFGISEGGLAKANWNFRAERITCESENDVFEFMWLEIFRIDSDT